MAIDDETRLAWMTIMSEEAQAQTRHLAKIRGTVAFLLLLQLAAIVAIIAVR